MIRAGFNYFRKVKPISERDLKNDFSSTNLQRYGLLPGKRAVVAVPPLKDFYFTPHRFSSLGAISVQNILKSHGYDVDFINFATEPPAGKTLKLPGSLNYLKDYLMEGETGKLSYFSSFKSYGPEILECAQRITGSNPSLIFISCFAFCYAEDTIELVSAIKNINIDVLIVIGGAGASVYPRYFLQNGSVDYVLKGEAEVVLPSFLQAIENGVALSGLKGVYSRWSTSPVRSRISSSEELSFLLSQVQTRKGVTFYSTMLSRGCPLKCRFCSNHLTHGNAFRTVPLYLVEDGFRSIASEGKRSVRINFEDDNLLWDLPYFRSVLELVRKYLPEASLFAENGIDYRLITPELLNEMLQAGFSQFNFSLASTEESVLSRESRSHNRLRYEVIVNELAQKGIPVITYFICGFKDDTVESVARTLRYLKGVPTLTGISLFYPVPGLPDFADPSLFDSHSPRLCCGSSAYPWNGSLSTSTLITAFRISRYINLIKSQFKSEDEEKLLKRIEEERKLYTFLKIDGVLTIVEAKGQDIELVKAVLGS